MYGYIYLTTNLINGKQYIGRKTSTKFLSEKYLGSGKYLKAAVKKYGKENFKVELLKCCESLDDLVSSEMYFIKAYNAVESNAFYNQSYGGYTEGWESGINNIAKRPDIRKINSEAHKGRTWTSEQHDKYRKYCEEHFQQLSEMHSAISTNMWKNPEFRQHMSEVHSGLKHTEESKDKIRKSNTGKRMMHKDGKQTWVNATDIDQYLKDGWIFGGFSRNRVYTKESNPMYGRTGAKCPSFGTVWVNNGKNRLRVPKDQLDIYLSLGYRRGCKF